MHAQQFAQAFVIVHDQNSCRHVLPLRGWC
jgi:hypothetical protein